MAGDRVGKVKKLLNTSGCSHILISDSDDAAYISGFSSTNVALLISKNKNLLFSDFRYKDAALDFCAKNKSWKFVEIHEGDFSFIGRFVGRGGRVGVQTGVISVDRFDKMKRKNRGVYFIKLGDAVSEISEIKLKKEVLYINRAASIADRAFSVFKRKIRVGMSEMEVGRMVDRVCFELGSEKPSFETIVLFGERTALPHGRPSQRLLKPGDLLLCDFGCVYKDFCSDMTRVMVVGTPTCRQKEIYGVVCEAQKRAKKEIRPGILSGQADSFARKVINKAGYGDSFGHATGHGVGRRIHEKPRLAASDKTILQKDMVITVEPGIYIPKEGGVRLEDLVLITENGTRSLSNSPRELFEIPL